MPGGEACGGFGWVYGFADEDTGNGVDVDGAVGAVENHIFNTRLRAFVVKAEVVETAPVAVDVEGCVRLAHIVGHPQKRGVVERHEGVFGRIHVVACQQLLGAGVVGGTRFGLIAVAAEALHLEAVFARGHVGEVLILVEGLVPELSHTGTCGGKEGAAPAVAVVCVEIGVDDAVRAIAANMDATVKTLRGKTDRVQTRYTQTSRLFNIFIDSGLSDGSQLAGDRVDNVAGNADIGGHERMVADQVDSLGHRLRHLVEAVQPLVEVDTAVAHERYIALGHTAFFHQTQHLGGIHALYAALGVPYDHYLLHAKLVDRYKERAHGGIERVGYHPAGILDNLYIAVTQPQSRRKQLHKTRIHAGDYGNLLVGIFGGKKTLVSFFVDKLSVVP